MDASSPKRYGTQRIQAEVLAQQQQITETFFQLKLILQLIQALNLAWTQRQ